MKRILKYCGYYLWAVFITSILFFPMWFFGVPVRSIIEIISDFAVSYFMILLIIYFYFSIDKIFDRYFK